MEAHDTTDDAAKDDGTVLRLFDVKGMGGAPPNGSQVKVSGVATGEVPVTMRGAKIPKGASVMLTVVGTVVGVGHEDVFATENGERVRVGTLRVHRVKCDDAVVTSWSDADGSGVMFDGRQLRQLGADHVDDDSDDTTDDVEAAPEDTTAGPDSDPESEAALTVDDDDAPDAPDEVPAPAPVDADTDPPAEDFQPVDAASGDTAAVMDIDSATEDQLVDMLRAAGVPNPPRVGVDTLRQMCRTVMQ